MIDPVIKKELGFNPNDDDDTILNLWKDNVSIACKPCWELKYCPYGPLVEDFPVFPLTKEEGIECDFGPEDLDECVETLPPQEILDCYCKKFGHICPVFFVKEPFTETKEARRITRYTPRKIWLNVVRRDNSQCQICGRLLKSDEIQLDHKIPRSKGGPTEEQNLRVMCKGCNLKKSNRLEI